MNGRGGQRRLIGPCKTGRPIYRPKTIASDFAKPAFPIQASVNACRFLVQQILSVRVIAESKCFEHVAYAKRYFDNKYLAPFSLLHFLLFGEKSGNRPNAFFDPFFFQKVSGGLRFAQYLSIPDLWVFSTSEEFQADEYLDRYFADVPSTQCPLVHFLKIGFDKGYDPSAKFETRFCRCAIFRDEWNVKEAIYLMLTAGQSNTCFTSAALRENQINFQNGIDVHALKSNGGPRRRDLLFIQAGCDLSRNFSPERSFDVLINYYEDPDGKWSEGDYIFYQNGTKVTAIAKLLEKYDDLLLSYESIMLLDDDVLITEDQIEALFALRAHHGLDVLQPALSERSACYFPHLKQPLAGSGLRAMTAVEIMMPIVSRRVIAELGHVFSEAVSGWNIDLLLSKLVRERYGETIALAADIVCEHLRPVDVRNGHFYGKLREAGIEPSAEAGRLAVAYRFNDKINAIHPVNVIKAADKDCVEE